MCWRNRLPPAPVSGWVGWLRQGPWSAAKIPQVTFAVTDTNASVKVRYVGILPDLFREGQGVVTEGVFSPEEGTFMADMVLAKHDENYMPKEVADALKAQGVWKEGDPPPGVTVKEAPVY
jgi:cytochrome c-type biogenesis protein CcmE